MHHKRSLQGPKCVSSYTRSKLHELKTPLVEAHDTERNLRKVKHQPSLVAIEVSVPDVIMKDSQVDEVTRHVESMCDEPEEWGSSVDIGVETGPSHKGGSSDCSQSAKTFIGTPSNWDPYSRSFSSSFIRSSQALPVILVDTGNAGPLTVSKEKSEARVIQISNNSSSEILVDINGSNHDPLGASDASQQTNSPKSVKDAVKLKNRKKNKAS